MCVCLDPLCRDLSTFGAVLTNQHLLVLSSAGVFVSSDLTLSSSDSQHILPFSHLNLFENATVSDPFQVGGSCIGLIDFD